MNLEGECMGDLVSLVGGVGFVVVMQNFYFTYGLIILFLTSLFIIQAKLRKKQMSLSRVLLFAATACILSFVLLILLLAGLILASGVQFAI